MKLTKCSQNHYYDGDKYEQCPHCNSHAVANRNISGPKLQSVLSESQKPQPSHEESTSRTSSVWNRFRHGGSEKTESITARGSRKQDEEMYDCSAQTPTMEAATEISSLPVKNVPEAQESASLPPLQAAVNAIKSNDGTDEMKTMAFYHIASTEPVVGWLVCVKGAYQGESFCLKAGKNTIGRSLKMDVPLAKEPSVSRDRHATIIYEPKKKKFFIQPGEGNGLTYLNDDLVMMPCGINDYDVLQLGASDFVLRSLCGDAFDWDKYL